MSDEKNKGGRPPYQPTDRDRAQVKALAAMGATLFEISQVLMVDEGDGAKQLSEPTIRKYFALELATGAIEANAKVAQSLYKQATDPVKPNVTAGIFWMKARAGWRDGRELRDEEETPGKKILAQQEAKTAAAGTDWEEILPGAPRLQ